MEIQSKTMDELLQKAEQVIRLLEVEKQVKVKSDDTKCEKSHKLEVVDQLRADNDAKGNSQEELRAYFRRAVAKDFHRVGFNCDEAVSNKFVEDLILDQERIRMEEENPKIEENYVLPTGNFMSYKWT
jgi:Asp-tRNA(Asn)/Glu-tRNA(Gln) amidotransferase C subunit